MRGHERAETRRAANARKRISRRPSRLGIPAGTSLVGYHMYTVVSFTRDAAGQITHVTLRNPWGYDGGTPSDSNPNDGLVTVSLK